MKRITNIKNVKRYLAVFLTVLLVAQFGNYLLAEATNNGTGETTSTISSGGPTYMAKIPGSYTDANGNVQERNELSQNITVEPGKTYEFSFNYYVDKEDCMQGRLLNAEQSKRAEVIAAAGEVGTMGVTYTTAGSETTLVPLIAVEQGATAYIWNLCFREADGTENLLVNADFSESDGSWIGWRCGSTDVENKGESDTAESTYGIRIMNYDSSVFGAPEYMAKLPGKHTDANGTEYTYVELLQVIDVEVGKTYEFSFNYYAEESTTVTGTLKNDVGGALLTKSSSTEVEKIQTMKITYTVADEVTKLRTIVSLNPKGTAYIWNLCFNEVGGTENLLTNADFSEGNGSWIGWSIRGQKATTPEKSDQLTAQFGFTVMKYDGTLFGGSSTGGSDSGQGGTGGSDSGQGGTGGSGSTIPSGDPTYMAKLPGKHTDASGTEYKYVELLQVIDVEAGKTYEFSFNYYAEESTTVTGTLKNEVGGATLATSSSTEVEKIQTMKITYKVADGVTKLRTIVSLNPSGTAYIWNLCFNEVGGTENLLTNADFSEGNGSWIGWSIRGQKATTPEKSDELTALFGFTVMNYDGTLFAGSSTGGSDSGQGGTGGSDSGQGGTGGSSSAIPSGDPTYMAKLPGNHTDAYGTEYKYVELLQAIDVEAGKTYEFSFKYYAEESTTVTGTLKNDVGGALLTKSSSTEVTKIQTMRITYKVADGVTKLRTIISLNPSGTAYIWNLCLNEVGGTENLLTNADFSEGDGSWIGWSIRGQKATTPEKSDELTAQFGFTVMKYDKTLFAGNSSGGNSSGGSNSGGSSSPIPSGDPKYMAKLPGKHTDASGMEYKYVELLQAIDVEAGKTYEFSFNYYAEESTTVTGALKNDIGGTSLATSSSTEVGKIQTMKVTYKVANGVTRLRTIVSLNPSGTAYVWNLCFKEVGGTKNLLTNADFSEGNGSWIGWSIRGQKATTPEKSNELTAQFGFKVMKYNKTLFAGSGSGGNGSGSGTSAIPTGDPKYMAKLLGKWIDETGVEHKYVEVLQAIDVEAGKTYEFSFNYYVEKEKALSGCIKNDEGGALLATAPAEAGRVGTLTITYKVAEGVKKARAIIAMNPGGIGYVWNVCFKEVGGTVNLLRNADFSEGNGSWIGWNIGPNRVKDKATSDTMIATYGHSVVPFDNSGFTYASGETDTMGNQTNGNGTSSAPTTKVDKTEEPENNNLGLYIGALAGLIVIIACAGALVFILAKKKKMNKENE